MFRSLAPLAVALAFLAGCATTAAPTNVADTASRTPQLSTLMQADQLCRNGMRYQQMSGILYVLSRNHIYFSQYIQCTQADIA